MAPAMAGPCVALTWLLSHSMAASLDATSACAACLADAAEAGDVDLSLIDGVQLLQSELQVHSVTATAGVHHGVNTSQPAVRLQSSSRVDHGQLQGGVQDQNQEEGDAAQKTTTGSAEYLGVSTNRAEDLGAFLTSIEINLIVCILILATFSVLRLWYPETYQNNVIKKEAPVAEIPDNYLSWYGPIQEPTTEKIAGCIGLDGAMLLEYCDMAKDMMWMIGVPMLFITGPLNWALGGNAADDDSLSYLSMGNVTDGNGLFYLHAVMVWYVIIVACNTMLARHKKFRDLRKAWLLGMPDRRACTVYVSNIPDVYTTDKNLYAFFDDMFPKKIKWARVVKDTSRVQLVYDQVKKAKENQEEAEHEYEKTRIRPTFRPARDEAPVDAYKYWKGEVGRKEKELKQLRKDIDRDSKEPKGVNISNGFVCFHKRVSVPPCTTDTNWAAAQTDAVTADRKAGVGIFMLLAMFFVFLPLVIAITNVANLINLGPLQSFWRAFAPTLGLTIMVSMLPTFLIYIVSYCYTLPAKDLVQLHMARWYFWFLIVFVVLATAIGQDIEGLIDFISTNASHPGELFTWLAETLPYSTHFFMNFMVLQCASHCMNMLRIPNLLKYIGFSKIFGKATALKMSEPEDQDYYGKGARSARWTMFLVIGLVFGTLSPLVNWTVWLNFWVQRNLAYGWLIPFAEQRKPDTGGHFWVQMCDHTFAGLAIYYILMNGVFILRAGTIFPHLISALSLFPLAYSYWRFRYKYMWERLPMAEITDHGKTKIEFPHPQDGEYKQPELDDS